MIDFQDAAPSNTIDNPCDHSGHEMTKSSDYLWAAPCCSGQYAKKTFGSELTGPANQTYTFKGRSNFTGCLAAIKSLMNNSYCNHGSCSFYNIGQPPLHGDFTVNKL